MGDAETSSLDDLEVRPPKQQRSREAWNRVLDAGVAILEDGGYDAFTIAAVCERASVAPTAIYARTTSKDALFLAVYEHGIAEHPGRAAGLRGPRALGRVGSRPPWSGRPWRRWSASRCGTSATCARSCSSPASTRRCAPGVPATCRSSRTASRAWCWGARTRSRTRTRSAPSWLLRLVFSTTIIRRRLRPGVHHARAGRRRRLRRRPGGDRRALPARQRSPLRQRRRTWP